MERKACDSHGKFRSLSHYSAIVHPFFTEGGHFPKPCLCPLRSVR